MSENENDAVPRYFLFFATLLSVVLVLSKFLHSRPKLNAILSEPAMVLMVGMFCSLLVRVFFKESLLQSENDDQNIELTATILSFPNRIFFMALLPPILFNSGYELQRELFYRHFKPIALFSAVGTTVSGIVTGCLLYWVKRMGWMGSFDPSFLELLTFGALIAATDTVSVLGVLQAKRVDPHLFSLVFGESALNDAVAIVLFHSFSSLLMEGIDFSESWLQIVFGILGDFAYQAICSPALGIIFAFGIALLFKHVDLRETKILELSLFVLLMYFPYVLAEECHLSGIVSIFFAGLSARRYIEPNVSEDTRRSADIVFRLVAYLAETCIFLELGLSFFGLTGSFEWAFIAFALVAALFGRAMSVYPISFFFNLSLKESVQDNLLEEDDISTGSISSSSTSSWSSRRKRRKTPAKRKDKKIPLNFMHIMWFAGLRGAVAYSCAREFPNLYGHRDEFIAATTVIVFVTVVIMGGCTDPLLDYLQIRMNVDEKEYMKAWRRRRKLKGFYHYFEYEHIYKNAVRSRPSETEHGSELDVSEISFQPMRDIVLLHKRSVLEQELENVDEESPTEPQSITQPRR